MWKNSTKYFLVNSRLRTKFCVAAFAFITLGGLGVCTLQNISNANAQGEGNKVLSVYDNNTSTRTSFRTDAKTVRAAFEDRGIEISKHDKVEPGLDEELSEVDYNVNIYRAKPVLIEDGAVREKIMSSSQTSDGIVKDAGIKVYDEDVISVTQAQNTAEDGVATSLKITRAKEITVDIFGKQTHLRTQADTVKDFLSEKSIKLSENDEVSVPLDTKIKNGDSFSIWRNGKQTITIDEEVEFEVEKIQDADKEVGYEQIKEAGEKGTKSVTYEVEIRNGQEVSRNKISEVETKKSKKQIVIVGIKQKTVLYTGGGTKSEWLAASGINSAYWGYVDAIVSRESGWNPNATNASSGACGLAQALPCSKVPGNGYNPIDSLRWMNTYVSRYGGWEGAYNFWQANHWY